MSSISKEAIDRTLSDKSKEGKTITTLRFSRNSAPMMDKPHYDFVVEQVRELDALVDEVATLLDTAANTNIAEIGEIERLVYDARDKIKQARGE